jgi:hypothetical protein
MIDIPITYPYGRKWLITNNQVRMCKAGCYKVLEAGLPCHLQATGRPERYTSKRRHVGWTSRPSCKWRESTGRIITATKDAEARTPITFLVPFQAHLLFL